jgi:hypothetical protein
MPVSDPLFANDYSSLFINLGNLWTIWRGFRGALIDSLGFLFLFLKRIIFQVIIFFIFGGLKRGRKCDWNI